MQMKLAAAPTLSYSLIGVAAVASILASLAAVAAIFGILPVAQSARQPMPLPPHDEAAGRAARAAQASDDGGTAAAGKHIAGRAVSETLPTVAAIASQPRRGGSRTALGVLGAMGGAFPGNARDGELGGDSRYRISVRMEDENRRTIDSVGLPTLAVGEAARVVEVR